MNAHPAGKRISPPAPYRLDRPTWQERLEEITAEFCAQLIEAIEDAT